MDLDETQAAVELVGKQMASENDRRVQRLIEGMDGSMGKAVNKVVGGLTSELDNQVQHWESQMETQMRTQMQNHWDHLEKKWESQIVQQEPGSARVLFLGQNVPSGQGSKANRRTCGLPARRRWARFCSAFHCQSVES